MLTEATRNELSDDAVILDGFDDCVSGVGSIFPHTHIVLIYDVAKIIDSLMEKSGMELEEAMDFYSYNIEGAFLGEGTPILKHD